MKNPFPDNPVFSRFLGLKDFFKQYQTKESNLRTRDFARIGHLIHKSGDIIAFDLLGSVNFGMAGEKSDIDIVIYLECGHDGEIDHKNCPQLHFYEKLVFNTLLHELHPDSKYRIEVVDAINLRRLKNAIEQQNFEDDIIARFVFYRTICRGVNKRILRPYEQAIENNAALFQKIEHSLADALAEFTRTSAQSYSFQKYLERLKAANVHIPASVVEKVVEYMNLTAEH